jgi:hypothetical protein
MQLQKQMRANAIAAAAADATTKRAAETNGKRRETADAEIKRDAAAAAVI